MERECSNQNTNQADSQTVYSAIQIQSKLWKLINEFSSEYSDDWYDPERYSTLPEWLRDFTDYCENRELLERK